MAEFERSPRQKDPLSRGGLQAFLLGSVELASVWAAQELIVEELCQRNDLRGVLFVYETPRAITLGRDASAADLVNGDEDRTGVEYPRHWINRGGGAWVHGPGLLSVNVIVPAERLKLSPAEYRDHLALALTDAASDLRIPAHPAASRPGAEGRGGQFGFVGAAWHSGIAYHGVCVNVSAPRHVIDAVDWGVRVTSLSAQRTRPISMASVRESLVRRIAARLGYSEYRLFTGHPWWRPSLRMKHDRDSLVAHSR